MSQFRLKQGHYHRFWLILGSFSWCFGETSEKSCDGTYGHYHRFWLILGSFSGCFGETKKNHVTAHVRSPATTLFPLENDKIRAFSSVLSFAVFLTRCFSRVKNNSSTKFIYCTTHFTLSPLHFLERQILVRLTPQPQHLSSTSVTTTTTIIATPIHPM